METPSAERTPAVLGFDTGFFHRLYDRNETAQAAWDDVRAERASGVISCSSLFELERLGLRGKALPRRVAEGFVRALPLACHVVWLGSDEGADRLHRAARLAHGNGLSMADALILQSLLDGGAQTVYTTDADLSRYTGEVRIVTL